MIWVVGGQTRNVGKTSLVENIIRAFPQAHWTAVKVTPHVHGAAADPQTTDTGRYLAAGAARAILLEDNLDEIEQIAATAENLIVESNTAVESLQPSLYMVVVDFSVGDFKDSAKRLIHRADAIVIVESAVKEPPWPDVPAGVFTSKPVFRVARPGFFSEDLRTFLATRLPIGK